MTSEMQSRLHRLESHVQTLYVNGDPSHDWLHIQRVVTMCRLLAKNPEWLPEGRSLNPAPSLPLKLELLLAAAFMHDLVNIPKDSPDRALASRQSAEAAAHLLARHGFDEHEITLIQSMIREHSYSAGLRPTSIESALLQDSDKLDSLGAIGVMRTTTCGAKMNALYYHEQDPEAVERKLDDRNYTLDHFANKLFKLPALMNTVAAKCIADARVEFMQSFVVHLKMEIDPLGTTPDEPALKPAREYPGAKEDTL